MINKWFNEDIAKVLNNNNRIVIIDSQQEGKFLLQNLCAEYTIYKATDAWSELEAKYNAEKNEPSGKVVFYTTIKKDQLTFLMEYAQTNGFIDLSDIEGYIKLKLFEYLKINISLSKNELMLAAKLSHDKDENWWKGVINGIIKPLDISDLLLQFLVAPEEVKSKMETEIWDVFEKEIYSMIDKPAVSQKPAAFAKETTNAIFNGLLQNSISTELKDIYLKWVDSNLYKETLKYYISNYQINKNISILNIDIDHCFIELDTRLAKEISKTIEDNESCDKYVNYLNDRINSKHASSYKASWLEDISYLLSYETEKLHTISSMKDFCDFYQKNFAKLDTALRKLYVAFHHEEKVLRPIQHYYEQQNAALLDKWFSLTDNYQETQKGIVTNAFNENGRIAVIVCDGLRLEIAEIIANRINKKTAIEIKRDLSLAVLPSITENGMSALYGLDEVVANAQTRFNQLKQEYPELKVIQLDTLNNSITDKHLILLFGDIDQVGEKKQLAGLKDIDLYEEQLEQKIEMLLTMGYDNVYLSTDHGFVITGILDEADKVPAPKGVINKTEERYILTNDPLDCDQFIEIKSNYQNSSYQYYAKTDKPFVTKGSYGYSHGGFTPQECIIPNYKFCLKNKEDNKFNVQIKNKTDLQEVTGNFFKVKIGGKGDSNNLFEASRKVKVLLYNANKTPNSTIINLNANQTVEMEYELTDNNCKIVIIDALTTEQLDSCEVKKSSARDLGGLF